MSRRELHPLFYVFSGVGRLLTKIFIIIMKIIGITVGLTLLGYLLGILDEITTFSIVLNNGFYYLGMDLQYNFAETFAALGFMAGFIGSGLLTTLNLVVPLRAVPVEGKPSVAAVNASSQEKDFDQSEIALLVPMVNNSLETSLYKKGINTVAQLANAKPEDLADLVGGSQEFAKQLIDDAQKTLDKLFRE